MLLIEISIVLLVFNMASAKIEVGETREVTFLLVFLIL